MGNVIVIGCGRVGSRLATMLSSYDNNVTVIDRDESAFASLGRDFNGSTIVGTGIDESTLQHAGIEECDFLASVTQSDNTNLMCVEIAKRLYDVPNAIARLYNVAHERTYSQLGIDYVCGTALVAEEIFSKVMSGVGDHITTFGDYEILQFALDLSATGKDSITVGEIQKDHIIRVCAFERADGSTSSLPTSKSVLRQGDCVLVAVRHGMSGKLSRFMQV